MEAPATARSPALVRRLPRESVEWTRPAAPALCQTRSGAPLRCPALAKPSWQIRSRPPLPKIRKNISHSNSTILRNNEEKPGKNQFFLCQDSKKFQIIKQN